MSTVEVDGQMCEDIRIGIYVRWAFGGKMYRRKGGGISMSFSSGLIEEAGGFRRFLEEWEVDLSGSAAYAYGEPVKP